MIRTTGWAVLLGAFLVACQSTDNMSMGPEAEAPVVQASTLDGTTTLVADDGESGERVTTGGISPDMDDPTTAIATLPLDFTGFRERLSSHVKRFSDLTVDGKFNAVTKIGNDIIHETGVIDCFTVTGSVARVEARVLTQNSITLPEPERVYFTVEDGNEKPDSYSGMLRIPLDVPPGAHCTAGLIVPAFAVETGNVQVRG